MISPTRLNTPSPIYESVTQKERASKLRPKPEALGPLRRTAPLKISASQIPSSLIPCPPLKYLLVGYHPTSPSQIMSGPHVVQCLCHGQMFLGSPSQSTGDFMLQVRRCSHSPSPSPNTYTLFLTSRWTLRRIPNFSITLPPSFPIPSTHRSQVSHRLLRVSFPNSPLFLPPYRHPSRTTCH